MKVWSVCTGTAVKEQKMADCGVDFHCGVDFDAAVAIFHSYHYDVNASEAAEKIVTGGKHASSTL